MKKFIPLTRTGWYYIFFTAFVFFGSLLRDINMMLLVGGLMLGPLFYSRHGARNALKTLTIRRRLLQQPIVGESSYVEYHFQSPHVIPALKLTDEVKIISPNVASSPTRKVKLSTHPKPKLEVQISPPISSHAETTEIQFVPTQRGKHQISKTLLQTSFPYGLLWQRKELKSGDEFIVWPATCAVSWKKLFGDNNSTTNVLQEGQQRQRSQQGDFAGLRSWQFGDLRRDIDWRSTARRNTLLVKQYDTLIPFERLLICDPWLPAKPTNADVEAAEMALAWCATLLRERGDLQSNKLAFLLLGEVPRYFSATAFSNVTAQLNELACVDLAALAHREESARDQISRNSVKLLPVQLTANKFSQVLFISSRDNSNADAAAQPAPSPVLHKLHHWLKHQPSPPRVVRRSTRFTTESQNNSDAPQKSKAPLSAGSLPGSSQ